MTFSEKFIIGFTGAKDFTLKTIMISNILGIFVETVSFHSSMTFTFSYETAWNQVICSRSPAAGLFSLHPIISTSFSLRTLWSVRKWQELSHFGVTNKAHKPMKLTK